MRVLFGFGAILDETCLSQHEMSFLDNHPDLLAESIHGFNIVVVFSKKQKIPWVTESSGGVIDNFHHQQLLDEDVNELEKDLICHLHSVRHAVFCIRWVVAANFSFLDKCHDLQKFNEQ